MQNANGIILVTGASGFLARHLIVQLIEAGYIVRGTLRNPGLAPALEHSLESLSDDPDLVFERFSWCEADLTDDEGWAEAMDGVSAVLHVAHPAAQSLTQSAKKASEPCLESTERVLRFMERGGVKRLILTSSVETIGYGYRCGKELRTFGPADWTRLEGTEGRYAGFAARTLAERKAWTECGTKGIALTTIHPARMIGPLADSFANPGFDPLIQMLRGAVSALPRFGCNFVDVRDVAAIHVAALQNKTSQGSRIIAAGRYLELSDVASILRKEYPDLPVPRFVMPDWMSRLAAWRNPLIRAVVPELGARRSFDGETGRALLGRGYTPTAQSLRDTVQSLFDYGLLDQAGTSST